MVSGPQGAAEVPGARTIALLSNTETVLPALDADQVTYVSIDDYGILAEPITSAIMPAR